VELGLGHGGGHQSRGHVGATRAGNLTHDAGGLPRVP
jgi:hypothetical protein